MVAWRWVGFAQYGIGNHLIQRDFLENIGLDEVQKNLWRDREPLMFVKPVPGVGLQMGYVYETVTPASDLVPFLRAVGKMPLG